MFADEMHDNIQYSYHGTGADKDFSTVNELSELEALAHIILVMYHGIAIQIIHNPSSKGNQ